ncbi:MAG TPA: insulinase family protein [Flavisolibacter sp.]|nr:insulinase family protein [Flavisolibacter sp.]
MKLNLLRCLSFVLVCLLSLQSTAQINMAQPLPMDPNVKVGKLPNGLTYYIRKNAKPEKKVELRLAINAGSILEENDQRGLAHFMEHMNFNGSKNFPKNELVDYLQKIGVQFGADLNAYTGFDETVYILPISSDDPEIVEKGFTVLEDWAFNNLLDKSEIDKERGVVLEESRLSKGSQERMLRQYFPKLFNGSKYAERLPIGKDSILQNFSYATLERFYRQWYRPNLMAVIVVGDIDPAEAEKKIKAHFSGFKNPANAKPRPAIIPIQPRTKPEALVVTDAEATNTVVQVFNFIKPAKKVATWADYREATIQELVNSLINQRLQELTQKENPPFVFGYTGTDQFIRGYDAFVSFAVLGNGTTKEAIDALVAETERARQFGFLATEVERAKATMLTGAERAYNERDKSQSGNLVAQYVNNFLEGAPVVGAENRYKFIKQVLPGITMKEINDAAKKLQSSANAFALVTAPSSQKDKLPTNDALLSQIAAATKQKVEPYAEKAVAASLMENGPAAGKIVSETKNDKLGTTNLVLSNGVTVTLKPTTFKNDEIVMDAWRHGGWHRFPLENKENAKSAAQAVGVMGVKDMTPTDLKKFLSGKSIKVTPYLNEHEEGIEGSSSVKDLENFLTLVNLYFTAPRKDAALLKSFVNNTKGYLQFVKEDPQTFFQDTLSKIMYNGSPWISEIPTAEELEKLDADKIMAVYNQIYGNAHGMHFTFVGNLDMEKVKPMLEKYLGSLPAQPMENKFKDNGVRPVKGVVNANIKKGKEAQSLITISWTGETEYKREDNLALKVLLDVLNIKVIEKLREELGGMYSGGLGGSIQKRPYAHYSISAYVPCGPENVDKLTTALFDIIKDAQQGKLEQKDLDKVKETLKKQYKVGLESNDTWLNGLSEAFINGTDPENMLNYEQRVDALTIADLQKTAQKFLNMNNYVRAVLYPENANVKAGVQKTF